MVCKNCGATLPARGVVCAACQNTMAPDQIEGIRQMNKAQTNGAKVVPIKPIKDDYYNQNPLSLGEYKPQKENKLLGALIILIILVIVIGIAIAKYISNV